MTLLQIGDFPQMTWQEGDLTLEALTPPRQAHPVAVLEAFVKGAFSKFLAQNGGKLLWYCPEVTVDTMNWEAHSSITLRLQYFGPSLGDASPSLSPDMSSRSNFALLHTGFWQPVSADAILQTEEPSSPQILHFFTPVVLPHRAGQAKTALDGAGFLRLCQTRVRKLFGQEALLPPPPDLDTSQWHYWRMVHSSRSQHGHPMYIHGCIGPLRVGGDDLLAWQPWLGLLARVGMGERLSFAQGRFTLQAAPPAQTHSDVETPGYVPPRLRRPLILDTEDPSATLNLDNGNLVLHSRGQPEQRLPLLRLSRIEMHAPGMISSSLLHACAEQNIPVLLAAPGNTPLVIQGGDGLARRYVQQAAHYNAWSSMEESRRVRLAAKTVDAKIAGHAYLVRQRYQRGDHSLLAELERVRSILPDATTLAAVRGWEGWAANQYWQWLQGQMQVLGEMGPRQKHGQIANPSNSLLNYGYGLLRHRLSVSVRVAGLNPWLGVLHEANGRHEALVSDFMELWRWSIDRLLLRAVGLHIVTPDSFSYVDGVLHFSRASRQRLVQEFTALLEATPRSGGRTLATRMDAIINDYARAATAGDLLFWNPMAEDDHSDPSPPLEAEKSL